MATERRTDIGPPHYERFLPPIIKANYGKWKYHEELRPGVMEEIVRGISDACLESKCALIGGEMAELPGFYKKGEYDLAGFALGIVERRRIIRGTTVEAGDIVIGLPSSGLHSNGYSLARRVLLEKSGWKPTPVMLVLSTLLPV